MDDVKLSSLSLKFEDVLNGEQDNDHSKQEFISSFRLQALEVSDVSKDVKEEREEKGDERRNKFAPDPLDRLICPRGYCLPYSPLGIKSLVRLYHLAKLVERGLCSSIRPWCIWERTFGPNDSSGSALMRKSSQIQKNQPSLNLTPCGLGSWRIFYHRMTMVFVSQ